jgi:carboxylesterase
MLPAASVGFAVGSPDSPRHILILHGYTGSPDSFKEAAERLSRELDAHVSVPLLPGHGTTIDDLQRIDFEEFLSAAREHMAEVSRTGKPFAVVGYCFGGFLAAITAAEYKPAAIAIVLTAYGLRFPFGIPGFARFSALRKSWDKYLYPDEVEMRKPFFYYPRMPGRSLQLVGEATKYMRKALPKLTMPLLTMHTTEDPTVSLASGANLLAHSGHNAVNESHILPHRRHALFFGPHKDEDIEILLAFLKKNL